VGPVAPTIAATVSVVTIAWRNEGFAEEFTRSLARAVDRAGPDAPELVVVQNGPDGEEATDAIRRASREAGLAPVVVTLERNTGFSGGSNAGVSKARGDVIVVANLDLTFDETFLIGLGRVAAEQPWDIMAPRVVQGAARIEAGVSRRKRSHRLAWVVPPPSGPADVPAGNGACIVLRRSALEHRTEATGALFDPEYHSFNEDIDLFWWAERERLVVRYAPTVRVDHALAGSFGGDYAFKHRPLEVQGRVMANYRVTVWKNARGLADWLGWPAGELQYLAQVVLSRGLAGVRAYVASWPTAVATVRAIRRRRGRLRVALSRSR
jgi:GT2 family glycosyltransferase